MLLGWYKAEFFGFWCFWVNFPTLVWVFLYFDVIWCFDFIFLLGWCTGDWCFGQFLDLVFSLFE